MNRIESAVTEASIDRTPLVVTGSTTPVLTPVLAAVAAGAAAGFAVGCAEGHCAQGSDGPVTVDIDLQGMSVGELLQVRQGAL